MSRTTTRFVRAGELAAELEVELIEDDTGWSPYVSPEEVRKIAALRGALERGDIARASELGRVYRLTPIMPGG